MHLLGCVGFQVEEGYRDTLSVVMLYGIGGASGFVVSALTKAYRSLGSATPATGLPPATSLDGGTRECRSP